MITPNPRFPRPFVLAGALLIGLVATSDAGPLERAQVNKIVNDVRIVRQQSAPRPAKVGDVVRDDVAVRTGTQSRAELLFQDQTLTRMGPDSLFSFKAGTREMTLDRGAMLLQVPKGLGGAQIRTAAVTAAITGTTIMLENAPGKHMKVVVLEGSLRLSMNKRFGGSVNLTPGKMIILGANEKRMPKPVNVDLAKLVKTSALVDPKKFQGKSNAKVKPLPSVGLIEDQIRVQTAAKASSKLLETGLVIRGNGTEVVNASGEKVKFDRALAMADNRASEQGRNDVHTTTAARSDVAKAQINRGGGNDAGARSTQSFSSGGKGKNGKANGNNGKSADARSNASANSGNTGAVGNNSAPGGNNGNNGQGKNK